MTSPRDHNTVGGRPGQPPRPGPESTHAGGRGDAESGAPDREEVLYEDETTRVVRVLPADEGPAVIRKESVGAQALESLRHERAILSRLVGVDGVPQLLAEEPQADWILTE